MFWYISLYLKSFRVKPCSDFSFHLYAASCRTDLTLRYLRIPAWLEKAKGRLYYIIEESAVLFSG